MTVAAYEQVLTGIDKGLNSDFQRLSSTRAPAAVSAAAAAIEGDVASDLALLRRAAPPTRFQTGNAAMISALSGFDTPLVSVASAADTSQVCTGTPAVALISGSAATARLLSAEALLSAVDPAHLLHLGSFLPPVTTDPSRRPANGTLIKRASPGGLGEMEVDNSGGSVDAVVSLVSSNKVTATAVYVHAGSLYTVHGIHDGIYQVYVADGSDWETSENLFARNCDFQKFDRTADFATRTSGDTTTYTDYDVKITPSDAGNATESKVPPEQFPRP
jgi:hypothetical protein